MEAFLRDADYIDVKQVNAQTSLRAFIAGMLSYYPWWVVALFRIREVLVILLGLVRRDKPERLPSLTAEDISFTPGENASFFIVCKAKEEFFWISKTPPDKHLMAYFGVIAEPLTSGWTRFQVITVVRYLHWTGPVYFNMIRPFHHLVVWRMMRAGATFQG
jgi:hypothetical protein